MSSPSDASNLAWNHYGTLFPSQDFEIGIPGERNGRKAFDALLTFLSFLGEEDNIIQVQVCAMVKDKRMKGILKDFPIPSSSTANYSHLPTSPISSTTMNRLSNQDIEDCMKYELCLWAAKRGMPVDIQIPQPI